VPNGIDGFGAGPELGSGVGTDWVSGRGTWGVRAGVARVVTPAPRGPSLALANIGSSDGLVQVQAEVVEPGFGLAFRCRGAANCWRIEADPDARTWNVVKVVGGRARVVTDLGAVPVGTGTTIGVEMRGRRLSFWVDRIFVKSIVDGAMRRVPRVGPAIAAGPDVTRARWRELHAAAREQGTVVAGFGDGPRLRVADTGARWATPRGSWGVRGDVAGVVRPAPMGASLALVDVGRGDRTVEVEAAAMEPGFGLAFRCRGPRNCWQLQAVPSLGTWNVVKIARGREEVRANLGTVPIDSGTTIAVVMRGERMRFFVDGKLARTVTDPAFHSARRAGLAIREGTSATDARWRGFRAGPSFWMNPRAAS
jgi:hypothetical protein